MYFALTSVKRISKLIRCVRTYTTASVSENKEDLIVFDQKTKDQFPLVWLRDNCRCSNCFHARSNSRVINWFDFDISPKIKHVEVVDNNVVLQWEDNHSSKYETGWLKNHSFTKEARNQYLLKNYRPTKIGWNKSTLPKKLRHYDFNEVMMKDELLYQWLIDLAQYGVAFLQNVPSTVDECSKLANKIGFIKKTHYQEVFEIVTKPNTTNPGYLGELLQLHTDSPYYEHAPGVTFLHCLVQTEGAGGDSLLSDCFYAAERLRKENKEYFDILSTVEVNWTDIGDEHGEKYHSMFRSPIIKLNSEGNFDKILYSVPQRDSHFLVDREVVKHWYRALRVFVSLIYDEAYSFKLKPGQLLAVDNYRLVHGRTGYKDVETNKRQLIGCHMDWDQVFSKIRVLRSECMI